MARYIATQRAVSETLVSGVDGMALKVETSNGRRQMRTVFDAFFRRLSFDQLAGHQEPVAQLVEQRTFNP